MHHEDEADIYLQQLLDNLVEVEFERTRLHYCAASRADVPAVERDLARLHQAFVEHEEAVHQLAAERQSVIDDAEADILEVWRPFSDFALERRDDKRARHVLSRAFELANEHVEARLEAFQTVEFSRWHRLFSAVEFEVVRVTGEHGFANPSLHFMIRQNYYREGGGSSLLHQEHQRLRREWLEIGFASLVVPHEDWEPLAQELEEPSDADHGLVVFVAMQAPAHHQAIELLESHEARYAYIEADGLAAAIDTPRGFHQINEWLLGDESSTYYRVSRRSG